MFFETSSNSTCRSDFVPTYNATIKIIITGRKIFR